MNKWDNRYLFFISNFPHTKQYAEGSIHLKRMKFKSSHRHHPAFHLSHLHLCNTCYLFTNQFGQLFATFREFTKLPMPKQLQQAPFL